LDVQDNPKGLKFLELDAAQLPRTLADADIAVINTNYANAAGLNTKEDSIAMEKADGPYVNVIVVRKGDEDQEWAKILVEAYQSDEVKAFVEDNFAGSVITSW
jgi:D-methionine transport system substrate-binding protein